MSDLSKLRGEHAELIELVKRLSAWVDQPAPPSIIALFELRREMGRTLTLHLKAEDWVLYPRLIASGDPVLALTAKAFSEEMGGLAGAFATYNDQWDALAIEADWAGYCSASRGIIAALTDRITRENRDLYPLLEALDIAA